MKERSRVQKKSDTYQSQIDFKINGRNNQTCRRKKECTVSTRILLQKFTVIISKARRNRKHSVDPEDERKVKSAKEIRYISITN